MASPAMSVISGVACVLLVALAIASAAARQRLVTLRDAADTAWAQLDVELKRRHDLVPHLADAVRLYNQATYDALAIAWREAVDSAAAGGGPAQRAASEAGLDIAIAHLATLADMYPEMRSDRHIEQLGGDLEATESRIAHSRHSLDEAIEAYNAAVRTLPTSILAASGRFRVRQPYR